MKKIFCKTPYFYNPILKNGEGEDAFYTVSVYKHKGKKNTPIMTFADRNPIKVLRAVHNYMEYLKNNKYKLI